MLTYQTYENGARVRYYSDAGKYIRQIETGALYEDAVHTAPCAYTYEETDVPIPPKEDEPDHIPAWDVTQAEYIHESDRVSRGGVTYRCISGHYAAWSKQPPNEEYWEEEPI